MIKEVMDAHATQQRSVNSTERTKLPAPSQSSSSAEHLNGLQLPILEQFLYQNFQVKVEKGQRVIQLNNGSEDRITIGLDEPTKQHQYRIKINDKEFSLSLTEFLDFADRYQIGRPEIHDQVTVTFEGKPIEESVVYDTGPGLLFSLAVNRLGYHPQPFMKGSVHEQKLWNEILKQIPSDTDRIEVKNILKRPPELEAIIKHSVRYNNGSGTIIELPDGRLGLATAEHVLDNQLEVPRSKIGRVVINGREYLADAVHNSAYEAGGVFSQHDYGILIFSEIDTQTLRKEGFVGIPVTTNIIFDRFAPIISLGYPAAEVMSVTGKDEKSFLLRAGQIYTTPAEGPPKAELSSQQYDGEDVLRVRGPRGMWTTSSRLNSGESGGGLFAYNSQTGKFELIGVHVACDTRVLVREGGMISPSGVGFHALFNRHRMEELLRSHPVEK